MYEIKTKLNKKKTKYFSVCIALSQSACMHNYIELWNSNVNVLVKITTHNDTCMSVCQL